MSVFGTVWSFMRALSHLIATLHCPSEVSQIPSRTDSRYPSLMPIRRCACRFSSMYFWCCFLSEVLTTKRDMRISTTDEGNSDAKASSTVPPIHRCCLATIAPRKSHFNDGDVASETTCKRGRGVIPFRLTYAAPHPTTW